MCHASFPPYVPIDDRYFSLKERAQLEEKKSLQEQVDHSIKIPDPMKELSPVQKSDEEFFFSPDCDLLPDDLPLRLKIPKNIAYEDTKDLDFSKTPLSYCEIYFARLIHQYLKEVDDPLLKHIDPRVRVSSEIYGKMCKQKVESQLYHVLRNLQVASAKELNIPYICSTRCKQGINGLQLASQALSYMSQNREVLLHAIDLTGYKTIHLEASKARFTLSLSKINASKFEVYIDIDNRRIALHENRPPRSLLNSSV